MMDIYVVRGNEQANEEDKLSEEELIAQLTWVACFPSFVDTQAAQTVC